nr:MFS transporter [Nocardioides piscis]
MSRLTDTVFPTRLGTGFRWLATSSWATNLGDGLMMAAGPLLVASQTRNPVLVAAAAMATTLPWLLFGLLAGALADRLDRRLLVMVMDAVRVLVLAALCLIIWTGHVDIWIVIVVLFAMGTAEVFADTTTSTLVPMLVDKPDLGIANARIQAGFITANQLIGPALGALLFAAGMALPFTVQAVSVALGVLLVSRIGTPRGAVRRELDSHLRQDIVEGMRWVAHHRPVRTLALVIVTFNITWAAPWSVLVLWAQDRVGLDAAGFGLLTTASALGGCWGPSPTAGSRSGCRWRR